MAQRDEPTEDEQEQTERQLSELLQEIRVATTGVQFLFAFLLTVAFQQRFAEQATPFQERVLLGALLLSVVAVGLLLAPVPLHRILFHQRDRREIIALASAMALVGLVALALAVGASLVLVCDTVFGRTTAWVVGGGGLAYLAALWFALPLSRRAALGAD